MAAPGFSGPDESKLAEILVEIILSHRPEGNIIHTKKRVNSLANFMSSDAFRLAIMRIGVVKNIDAHLLTPLHFNISCKFRVFSTIKFFVKLI